MNVRCPSCDTVYRIDPAKVPEEGVQARCTVCSHVVAISRDEEPARAFERVAPAAPEAVAQPAAPEPRAPARSGEEIAAATLGDAFIAPPKAPPTVVEAPAVVVEAPVETPAPVVEAPAPVVEAPPAAPQPPVEAPAPAPAAPPVRATPVAPPAARPQPAAPVSSPVERGGLRVTRPFAGGGPGAAPARSVPGTQRPTAPVFRPTPGAPVRPAAAPPEVPAAPTPPEPVAPAQPAVPEPPPSPPVAAAPVAPPPQVVPPAAPVAPPAAPEPAVSPAPAKPVLNPFMSRDPKQKARRLARALISDMIVYQPEKRQKAIEEGSLKEVFDEEIKKSWDEYVQQVGAEIANSTPFFTEALNDILAGGQNVF